MFDIGWSELIIIGVIALIAIGPKELPTVMRSLAHWIGKIKRMAGDFQGQFQEALREAELADLKKQADDLTGSVSDIVNIDPMADTPKKTSAESADTSAATASEPVDEGIIAAPYDTAESATPAAAPAPEPAPASEPAPDKTVAAADEDLAPAAPPPKQAGGKA
jgi:sec-independent protein translocase protein TatB